MAYWQRRYIREAETFTRGGTYRLDLPDVGMLGSVLLRIDGTKVSDCSMDTEMWRIIDFLTDVEVIVNGSKVLKDLTGYQAQAISWFDQGVMPDTKWNQYATGSQKEYILINFGRCLMDELMGLDLSRYDQVQLRLKNNASSTYYGSDWTVTTLGYFMEEGGAFPLGFIKSEEYKSYSATADTWEYNDLPTEGKLRRLILNLEADIGATYHELETSMDNMGRDIKVTFDSGGVIAYEGGVDDLMREVNLLMGRDVVTRGIVYRTASYHQRNGLGRVFGAASAALELTADAVTDKVLTFDGDYDRGTSGFANAMASESNQMVTLWGTCPHSCLWIPFTKSDEPEDWIDLAIRKTMKVDIHAHNTGGATGGACSIVLERAISV